MQSWLLLQSQSRPAAVEWEQNIRMGQSGRAACAVLPDCRLQCSLLLLAESSFWGGDASGCTSTFTCGSFESKQLNWLQ